MTQQENHIETFFIPSHQTKCTKTLSLFASDYIGIVELFFFTIRLADASDNAALTASKALIKLANTEEERSRLQSTIDNPGRAVKKLRSFSSLNSRNLTVNIADAFLWYVSAIIQVAMKKRPQLVKSSETIRVEEIFDYKSRRELVNYLIDRKVNALAYGGISKIEKFIADSLGVDLFLNPEEQRLMGILIEVRNILVHNRGIVNRIFLHRVKDRSGFSFAENKPAHLDYGELVRLTSVCINAAIRLDDRISQKFGIERKRLSTWRRPAEQR